MHTAWVVSAASTPTEVVWECAVCGATVTFVREGSQALEGTPTSDGVKPPENIETYVNKDCTP